MAMTTGLPGLGSFVLRTAGGRVAALPVPRWLGVPAPEEEAVLDRAVAPVLDVGCGPGRHLLALAQRGVFGLGIDVAPSAVQLARARGAAVIERSIFDRIPGAGRWGSALLLDGNIGIGGDPAALFRRLAELLLVLVELEPPGTPCGPERVRLEVDGRAGPWFPWARVGREQKAPAWEHDDVPLGVLLSGPTVVVLSRCSVRGSGARTSSAEYARHAL